MPTQNTMTAATFTAIWTALFSAHWVADHWIQTGRQAQLKGKTGAESRNGRLAAFYHILTYVITQVVILAAVIWALHLPICFDRMVLGLTTNAAAHWWADRRWTLGYLAKILNLTDFYQLAPPLGGAYLMDQAWHYFWLLPTALIIVS